MARAISSIAIGPAHGGPIINIIYFQILQWSKDFKKLEITNEPWSLVEISPAQGP